jgi:uncharacterized protein (DUF2384 family)
MKQEQNKTRMTKLVEKAESVFANHEKASHWLNKRQKSLNELTPTEAVQQEVCSVDDVINMIKRIDSGYF